MAKVLEFKAKNVRPFTSWLKRFASVDNSLLLEIDTDTQQFLAKTYNAEKSVVKFSKISFKESGLELEGKTNIKELSNKRIRVGLYHLPRLIKSIDHFLSSEFSFGFKYEDVIGENEGLAGTDIQLKNPILKMNIKCTSLHIFKYITDNVFLTKIAKLIPLVNFELPNLQIEKINSLCGLDNEYRFIDFKTKSTNLTVKGKTFELIISESAKTESAISIYKLQFDKLDIENYSVEMSNEKLVFKSKDSDTITVISMVERDSKFEENTEDF